MRTRNRKNLRKDRLKRYLRAKYGMKYDKGGKTGEGNPPEADFLLKRDPLADYDRETVGGAQGAQDLDTGGFTTASDNARAQMDLLVPPGGMEPERGPEDMERMRKLGPKVIRRDQKRGLKKGDPVDMPVAPDRSEMMLYGLPSTGTIRAYVPGLDGGRRAYGFKGYTDEEREAYEKADRIPYGFRLDGKNIAATPEALDMLREQGVGARGRLTEDSLRELYDTNPELFGTDQKAMREAMYYLKNKVMDEATRGLRGDFNDGYYLIGGE